LSFTYDALGRNLTQVGPQGTVTSTWDIGGRRMRITHPDSFYVDQDYLVTGELQKIRENGATSGVGVLATYAYDDLGRRTLLTLGDGSSTSYTFDAVSRLSQLVHDLSGTSYDQTLGFSYNPASEITQNTRSNDTYAWTGHYNVNRGYTANGLNQYTASGSVTPTYDSKGSLTSAGSTTYGYSSENLLTSASGGITLAYDPAMRLYQTAGGTPGTTRFQYDGMALIAEYNSSNTLQRRYVHGSGTDEPIVWYEGSGTSDRRFLHSDERGSVVSVSSSSGTTINTYDEYGIPRSTNTGRFQYTGQTWLPELGMYYYKARIYSPTLGRFLQTDPIGYAGGANLYAYAGAGPISRTDPQGTDFVPADTCGKVTGSNITRCGENLGQALHNLGFDVTYLYVVSWSDGTQSTLAQEAPTSPPRISQDFTNRTIATLQRGANASAHVTAALLNSVGSTTQSKNEWGFWSKQTDTRLIDYPIFTTYDGPSINPWSFRPPGANVFTHIHPFTYAESGLQLYMSGVDLVRASRNGILVVSVSYNGIWDWANYRECATCSGKPH
jgi:RHS repeat-associated protein